MIVSRIRSLFQIFTYCRRKGTIGLAEELLSDLTMQNLANEMERSVQYCISQYSRWMVSNKVFALLANNVRHIASYAGETS